MGTLTKVKQMLKLPNGTIRVLVEGLNRAKIVEFIDEPDYYRSFKNYLMIKAKGYGRSSINENDA